MNLTKRLAYRSFVLAIRAYQRLFLDLRVWGKENIPPGPKIFVTNHITSTDPYWILPILPQPSHLILGPIYNYRWLVRVLNAFEQISAMPAHHKSMVEAAVHYLRKGETIAIAPEGDLSPPFQLGTFHAGVALIYRQVRAPLIPMALIAPRHGLRDHAASMEVNGRVYRTITALRGTYCINIGEPFLPECTVGSGKERNAHIMNELRQRMERLMEDVRVNKFWLEGR